jgi:hypothetical protein
MEIGGDKMAEKHRIMIKEAMEVFGDRVVTHKEIKDYVYLKYGIKKESLNCPSGRDTANHPGRLCYPENVRPRIIDGSDQNDMLYRVDIGKVVLFKPEEHGVWEIRVNNGRLSVGKVEGM